MRDTDSNTLKLRGYTISLFFQPEVKLLRASAFAFAEKLSPVMNFTNVDVQPEEWVFQQQEGKDPRGRLVVQIKPQILQIDGTFPTQEHEWHDAKQDAIMESFAEMFKPGALVRIVVVVRYELSLESDARKFLSSKVMAIPEKRLRLFGRPIHVVGLRLGCPHASVKQDGDGGTVFYPALEVKIESLAEDPTKLFLEAAGDWSSPMLWDETVKEETRKRLAEAKQYLKTNLLGIIELERKDDTDE